MKKFRIEYVIDTYAKVRYYQLVRQSDEAILAAQYGLPTLLRIASEDGLIKSVSDCEGDIVVK